MFFLPSSEVYMLISIPAFIALLPPLIWSLQTLILRPTSSSKLPPKKRKKSCKKAPSLLVLFKIKPKKRRRRRCCRCSGKTNRKEEEEEIKEEVEQQVLSEMAYSRPIRAGASVGKMERKICDWKIGKQMWMEV